MAKKKLYGSSKAKTRTARLVNRFGKEAQQTSTDKESILKNILRVHGQWESRNGYNRVDSATISDIPGMVFISNSASNPEDHAVCIRIRNVKERILRGHDLKTARELFLETSTGKISDSDWWSVDSYLPQARSVLITLKNDPTATVSFSRRYGFIFAVEELVSTGFTEGNTIFPKERNQGDKNILGLAKLRRRLCDALGNRPIANNPQLVANECLESLIKMLGLDQGRVAKSRTFMGYLFLYTTTLERASRKIPNVYAHLKVASDILFKDGINYERNNLASANKKGTLLPEEPHDYIPINKLEKLLDIAFSLNYELYNFIILSLTTGLRPEDMKILAADGIKYITDVGALSFKQSRYDLEDEVSALSGKTASKKRDPQLSIIANIILKHYRPSKTPKTFFAGGSQDSSFRTKHPDLAAYYERTLRTTCATMLAYSNASKVGPIALNIAKNRFGHKNMHELITRYAVETPADYEPEKYLQLYGLKFEGVDIGKGSVLWDMWLLRNWIVKFKTALLSSGDTEGYKKLKKIVLDESHLYQSRMVSDLKEETPTEI